METLKPVPPRKGVYLDIYIQSSLCDLYQLFLVNIPFYFWACFSPFAWLLLTMLFISWPFLRMPEKCPEIFLACYKMLFPVNQPRVLLWSCFLTVFVSSDPSWISNCFKNCLLNSRKSRTACFSLNGLLMLPAWCFYRTTPRNQSGFWFLLWCYQRRWTDAFMLDWPLSICLYLPRWVSIV